ncbi:MAG: hypothetical protein JF588_22840 [Caulobacterales bacterium]|nr:hypothetical protein [Caulobacterales bacterium]
MTAAAASPAPNTLPARDALARIALAGLAGGAVDFVYASALGLMSGRGFVRVWQGVASGWLGKAAAHGGMGSLTLGLVTHFGIATCMAAAYALVAARAPILYRRWWLAAPLYGVVLYGVMYKIVLPLRFPGAGGWHGLESVADVASHIGLALAAAFVLSRPRPQ